MTKDVTYPLSSFHEVVVAEGKAFTTNFHSGSTIPVKGRDITTIFPDVTPASGQPGWLSTLLLDAGLGNLST